MGWGAHQLMGEHVSYVSAHLSLNLVIIVHALSLLFCNFKSTTGYHLGRYEQSFPSTKEPHAWGNINLFDKHTDETLQ